VGIAVQWDNAEKTVILVTFEPEWTWRDVQDIDAQSVILYDSVGHLVDIIADVRNSRMILTGILSYVRSLLTTNWHPLTGIAVVVGVSPSVRALFDAAALVARKPLERIIFVQTLEEAREMIQQRRAKR
jgi:hypothetical protein